MKNTHCVYTFLHTNLLFYYKSIIFAFLKPNNYASTICKRLPQQSRHISAHDKIIYDIYDMEIHVLVLEIEGHYNDK